MHFAEVTRPDAERGVVIDHQRTVQQLRLTPCRYQAYESCTSIETGDGSTGFLRSLHSDDQIRKTPIVLGRSMCVFTLPGPVGTTTKNSTRVVQANLAALESVYPYASCTDSRLPSFALSGDSGHLWLSASCGGTKQQPFPKRRQSGRASAPTRGLKGSADALGSTSR